jgi:heme A synthase
MTTTAKVVSGQSAFMDATSTLQASVKVTKPFRSTMSSTTAMVVEGFTGIIGEGNLTSQSTLACAPTKRASARAATQSNFSLSANLGATRRFISLEMSSGTLTVTATLAKNVPAALVATATLSASGGLVRNAQAQLACEGFVLSDGTVINLEASAIWIVPKEITLWTVPVENREYIVEFEQRSFTIKG